MDINEKISSLLSKDGMANAGSGIKKFWKNHTFSIVAIIAGLILGFFGINIVSGALSDVAAAERKLMNAKNNIDTFDVGTAAEEEVIIRHIDHGMNAERWQRDDAIALTFLSPGFRWSNAAEYIKNREYYVQKLGANHWFVTDFMPVYEPEYVDLYSESGTPNDGTHLSCNFTGETPFKTYVVSIDETNDIYYYVAVVHVVSKIPNTYKKMYHGQLPLSSFSYGQSEPDPAYTTYIMTYNVDSTGEMHDYEMFMQMQS